MRHWLNQRFDQAIAQRFPAVMQGRVGQRQLFVLPSLNGMLWLVLALIIWLTGINYQNGLVLLVAYLMASIWLAAMWLCYRNLLGIAFHIAAVRHAQAGEQAEVDIEFTSQRARYDIAVRCTTGDWRYTDVSGQSNGKVRVLVDLPTRGVYTLPALRIETRQPFDLAVVWSQLRLSCELLAYPVAKSALASVEDVYDGAAQLTRRSVHGDIDGLTDWQEGQETTHLRWQHYLLTGEARVLDFAEPRAASSQMLSLQQYAHLSTEAALAAIAYQAETYYHNQIAYGVDLGRTKLAVGLGSEQLNLLREALARYGN